MAFEGLDPEVIRSIASRLNAQAAQLQGAMAGCQTALQSAQTSWQGPDAASFHTAWSSSHRPAMQRAHDDIAAMATTLLRQVQEQTTTSNDLSGTAVAGPAGTPYGTPPTIGWAPTFPGGPFGGSAPTGTHGGYLGLDGLWHSGSTGTEDNPANGIQGIGYQYGGSASAGSGDGLGGSGYHAGASGYAFAGINLGATQQGQLGGLAYHQTEQLTAGASASGHANAGIGPNGAYYSLGAAAMAGAIGTVTSTGSYGGVTATNQLQGQAGASADGVSSMSIGKNGVEVNQGFDAMAGASVGDKVAVSGGGVTVGGGASVGVGFGADAGADNTFGPHDIGSTGHLGLAFIGKVGISWNIHIDPTKVAGEAVHVLDNVGHAASNLGHDAANFASSAASDLTFGVL